jgi:DNA invertase Pin-like site-specific DNA recombinase
MTSAAIYARVSSARQKKDQTIGSQTQALRGHAAQHRLDVPAEWVFEDEGHSGATLVRPGLEAPRDLAAQGCLDVVLCYSPDRLARKFACQALLIEEFARAGVRVEFIKNGPRGDSPEDQLLVQFQGMFAEYEKAQLMERYRRGKTMAVHEPAGLNRAARLQGRSVPRAVKTVDRPRGEWTEIAGPAIVTAGTFARVQQRLADNKRFAARNTKIPSLLPGLAACSARGYGYYRTSTPTTNKKIYYYRCLGSDDYRCQGGRACHNQPVRAGYLDTVVWDHITALLAAPALIRAEISKRLEAARTSDPVTGQRKRLDTALAKATAPITAMIQAFSEQLITIDELRARMPHLRSREANLRGQLDALDAQAADRDAYLKLAGNREGFLTRLRTSAATATVEERQRVLRLLVKDILIGPEKITIRHRIPTRADRPTAREHESQPDPEGDHRPGYLLRWGRVVPADLQHRHDRAR